MVDRGRSDRTRGSDSVNVVICSKVKGVEFFHFYKMEFTGFREGKIEILF